MSISRTRLKGPEYHQPHRIGQSGYYDPGKKKFVFNITNYCVGDRSYTNCWIRRLKQCVDETHPGPPWKDGGPLFIKEWDNPCTCGQTGAGPFTITSPNGTYQYKGSFFHATAWSDTTYGPIVPMADLGTRYGAVGWNRFRPARPSVDLGQFFGELREFAELLPNRLKSFIDLGPNLYLNYQFGWKPFLRDIADFFESMSKVERTISFLRKNNNKWILRGGTISTNEETGTESTINCAVRPLLNQYYHLDFPITASPTKVLPVTSERIWFKARMKYYIPDVKVDKCDNVFSSRILRKIYGLEISPALFWKLTPWSWLVDWYCNYGDVISVCNAMVNDNLTAKYAYVMRTWEKRVFYNTSYKFSSKEGIGPVKLSTHNVITTKQRAEASPFGFRVGWDELSSWQLSILAALGLSRVR